MNTQIFLFFLPLISLGAGIALMMLLMYAYRHNGAYKEPYPITLLMIMFAFYIAYCTGGSLPIAHKNEPTIPLTIRKELWELQKKYPNYQFTITAPQPIEGQ